LNGRSGGERGEPKEEEILTETGAPGHRGIGASQGRESAVTGVDCRDGAIVVSLAGELDLYNASGLDRHFLVHDTVAEALEAAH
jgi:hypothetical protein